MSYLLFTGATGLLGGYLLRDLSKAEKRLAVVVRKSRIESARGRIESIMARWERILGYALPRPVVLSGDITKPLLGFDEDAIEWVRQNCEDILHNAASLSFEETSDGEPFRSNVLGAQNTLDLCQQTGIRRFFHVSTAYVCGLRTGHIRENELDEGQQPANPYEASKIEAEKMVRGTSYLDHVTVFRPSIIIGDSVSGYTSTYHGFYAPLKSFYALTSYASDEFDSRDLMKTLGFSGSERKNFIPVDWVSSVMTHVICRPELHGQIYHLTPDEAISVAEVTDSMARSVAKYGQIKPKADLSLQGLASLGDQFQELLSAYRSYWRNDPVFDKSNTDRAAPHIKCPALSPALMDRLCRFAIQANFGWPIPLPIKPEVDFAVGLESTIEFPAENLEEPSIVGLQINGPGGGQWSFVSRDGLTYLVQGISDRASVTLYLNSKTMQRIVGDPDLIDLCIKTGRLLPVGDRQHFARSASLLYAVATSLNNEKVVA